MDGIEWEPFHASISAAGLSDLGYSGSQSIHLVE